LTDRTPKVPRHIEPGSSGHKRWLESIERRQEKARQLREACQESFEEIGESLAQAVLEGDKSVDWAWKTICDFGMYERWQLDVWLKMYRTKHRRRLEWLRWRKRKILNRQEQNRQAVKTMLHESQASHSLRQSSTD
jgi:hypothetical protein